MWQARLANRIGAVLRPVCMAAALGCLAVATARAADPPLPAIVAHSSLTGPSAFYGPPFVDGAHLAVEDANADGGDHIELTIVDDHSTGDGARLVAKQADTDGAVVVIGPELTTAALAAGPVYGAAGLPAIAATAHSHNHADAPTIFRPIFSTAKWPHR
jgi:ABC-type branched-subunit amino acid transport system substrate-binding protein